MVVVVTGLPGSGKSFFAERLAKTIDADYINSDRLRKRLFPKRTYSDSEKASVYKAMLIKMEAANAQEKDLVLDATFHTKKTRELFAKKRRNGVRFIVVWAEEPIIKERLKKSRPYSEADADIYQLILQQWERLERPHLKLQSTNENIDDMLQKAVKYVKDDTRGNR